MLKKLFQNQKSYINYFFDRLDLDKTEKILEAILACRGHLFFSGVGKSGIIATKLSVTFSSLGTKAFFLSPLDAMHGDLGRISKEDLFFFLSKSGYTKELVELVPHIKKRGATIISIVCVESSPLQIFSDLYISLPFKRELCPYNLAPTTSTSMQLIFGDVLAIALMQKKRINREVFAFNHPKGSIGKKLAIKILDIMRKEEKLPMCSKDQTLLQILPTLSQKGYGAILILDKEGYLEGIFTDGDLRRALEKNPTGAMNQMVFSYMTKNPKSIAPEVLAIDALERMEKEKIMMLPVIDKGKVIGIIHMHDILGAGLKS